MRKSEVPLPSFRTVIESQSLVASGANRPKLIAGIWALSFGNESVSPYTVSNIAVKSRYLKVEQESVMGLWYRCREGLASSKRDVEVRKRCVGLDIGPRTSIFTSNDPHL